MYIVFYICARIYNNAKLSTIIFVLSFAFVIICYACGFNGPWYGSTFCFWLGIFYYINGEKFKKIADFKYWISGIAIFSVLMIISMGLFFIDEEGLVGDLIGRNIASVSFVMLVIFILYRFKPGNPVSFWLGKCSYEIFLVHPVFIAALRPEISNDVIFAFAVIILSVVSAYIYCLAAGRISQIIKE